MGMLKNILNLFFNKPKNRVICVNCGYQMLIQTTERKRIIEKQDIIDFEVDFWYCSFCNTKQYIVHGGKIITNQY